MIMSVESNNNLQGSRTDFGFEQVLEVEKTERVAKVFNTVADRYDLMNDLLSLGSHRLLKHIALDVSAVRPGARVLDLAGGTGDLAMLMADKAGPEGTVILADINISMLEIARDRLADRGYADIQLLQADAEALPLPEASIDLVVMAFGLRNVTRKEQALMAVQRCLVPGGRLLVLEFSRPKNPLLKKAFAVYTSFWPLLGKVVAGDAAPYRYLVESIAMHPNKDALALMFEDAGFAKVRYHSLMAGAAAIHIGFKPL